MNTKSSLMLSPVLNERPKNLGERRRALGTLAGLMLMPLVGRTQSGGMAAISGGMAPSLALPDLDDEKIFDLKTLRGRVVLVNFWATWCPPCRRELPSLARLQKLFRTSDFTVIAVNVGEEPDAVFSFVGTTNFPVLLDRDSSAMMRWSIKGLPTTYVVDRSGKLVLRATGGRDFDDPTIVSQIKELLKGGG